MRRDDFDYNLPESLIAQRPPAKRGQSRLLRLTQNGLCIDYRFADLPDLLSAGDLLVFNDTRVLPARLFARKESGGKVEILLERLLDSKTMLAQLRFSKTPKTGSTLIIESGQKLEIIDRDGSFFHLRLVGEGDLYPILEESGHMPLPPYIQRSDEAVDRERYQTVYAKTPGAVAAPTAGLHFTKELLEELESRGINSAFVTLHVGSGTFQPVREELIEDHRMHREYLEVSKSACDLVKQTRNRGGKVIAVGTTAVRCLETATRNGEIHPYKGETDIFIYPGYNFQMVDGLITNFHLPESTLLMLVCALAGKESVLSAYEYAIRNRYRFYSYGDAMLLL